MEVPVDTVALLILEIMGSKCKVVVGIFEGESHGIRRLYKVVVDMHHKCAYRLLIAGYLDVFGRSYLVFRSSYPHSCRTCCHVLFSEFGTEYNRTVLEAVNCVLVGEVISLDSFGDSQLDFVS